MPETAPNEEEKRVPWVYGVNNHVERLSSEVVQAFRASGHLREDYGKLCRRLGLVGHHELMPQGKVGTGRGAGNVVDVDGFWVIFEGFPSFF